MASSSSECFNDVVAAAAAVAAATTTMTTPTPSNDGDGQRKSAAELLADAKKELKTKERLDKIKAEDQIAIEKLRARKKEKEDF